MLAADLLIDAGAKTWDCHWAENPSWSWHADPPPALTQPYSQGISPLVLSEKGVLEDMRILRAFLAFVWGASGLSAPEEGVAPSDGAQGAIIVDPWG